MNSLIWERLNIIPKLDKLRPHSSVVKRALDVGESAVRFCVGPFT